MGILYVVGTPIGNLEDITIRAIKVLLSTPTIICEDTRHTGNLIKLLIDKKFSFAENVIYPKRYISVRDWNEKEQIAEVLSVLNVSDAAMVSDAGTPLLSDPGFKVVRAAREAGIKVVPIPGAFAGATAASAAGLPTNKLMFWGFLPKKWELAPNITHVIYESPVRAERTLREIKLRYPAAKITVAKELTKIHEYIGEDLGNIDKGEITLLIYHSSE